MNLNSNENYDEVYKLGNIPLQSFYNSQQLVKNDNTISYKK